MSSSLITKNPSINFNFFNVPNKYEPNDCFPIHKLLINIFDNLSNQEWHLIKRVNRRWNKLLNNQKLCNIIRIFLARPIVTLITNPQSFVHKKICLKASSILEGDNEKWSCDSLYFKDNFIVATDPDLLLSKKVKKRFVSAAAGSRQIYLMDRATNERIYDQTFSYRTCSLVQSWLYDDVFIVTCDNILTAWYLPYRWVILDLNFKEAEIIREVTLDHHSFKILSHNRHTHKTIIRSYWGEFIDKRVPTGTLKKLNIIEHPKNECIIQ
jgi:hypothetical protein